MLTPKKVMEEIVKALDIVSRKRWIEGDNVLLSIGFETFGLPTENFAIKNHVHPREGNRVSMLSATPPSPTLPYHSAAEAGKV